jgi:hypothetical protein
MDARFIFIGIDAAKDHSLSARPFMTGKHFTFVKALGYR